MGDLSFVLTVYEARWHGWARWTAEEHELAPSGFGSYSVVVWKGWVRGVRPFRHVYPLWVPRRPVCKRLLRSA